jgi:hypothetical protein
MRLSLVLGAVACGLVASAVAPPTASACCALSSEADLIAGADVIFEGVALEGATETGIQRFRVTRYLKSTGPEIVNVNTGHRSNGTFIFATSTVSIHAEAGSEWRIFGYGSPDVVVQANSCTSKRLPLPPLGKGPLPPSGTILVQPGETPAGETRSGSGTVEVTTPVKKLKSRQKAKRPLSAKTTKTAKKRALRSRSR